jgi:hypothetical protein
MMANRGFVILAYLDDMLCVGKDYDECKLAFDTLVELIESLGLVVNWKKCEGPVDVITFLGISIDCVRRILTLPEDKLLQFRELVDKWSRRKRVTKLELQKFLGKLNWASRVVRGGRTFMRHLIYLLGHLIITYGSTLLRWRT